MSTRPALTGEIAWDIAGGVAFPSGTHRIRVFELMPTGTIAEDKWIVTRQVISNPDLSWSSTDYSTPSYESLSTVNHPFTESLTAETTSKVRYLYIDEYDGDSGEDPGSSQLDSIQSITIQTYIDDGGNRDMDPEVGAGVNAPTWYFRTTDSAAGSGESVGTAQNTLTSPMTIVNFPALQDINDHAGVYGTVRNMTVYGLSANYPSTEGHTAGLSGINTMGSIHFQYDSAQL